MRDANSIAVATLTTALAVTRGYPPLGALLVPIPSVRIEAAGYFVNAAGRCFPYRSCSAHLDLAGALIQNPLAPY